MRLIHCADIHLDSPLHGLAAYDGAPASALRLATREALSNLVDTALDEAVDAVLIAGDIFDGDWPHYGTGAHFAREMARLAAAGIFVIAIAGNHDAESKLTRSLRMPENVRVLSSRRPETALFSDIGLAVHGQSYAQPQVFDDLSKRYPQQVEGFFNVGLLHTCADGRLGHEPYAPCRVEELCEKGYDYWALGHVHHRAVLAEQPYVVFSGNLQGRHVRETGGKGATIVDVAADGSVTIAHRNLDHVRWAQVSVDASGADEDEIYTRAGDAIRSAAVDAEHRLLAARVVIEGSTDAHAALVSDPDKTRYEVTVAAAELSDSVWIERVIVDTAPRRTPSTETADGLAELLSEISTARADDETVADLASTLAPLADKLPGEVRREWDPSDLDCVRDLLTSVEQTLPSRLLGSEGEP